MKKKILLTALLLTFTFISRAQITGNDTTCAGYIYTYNATIANADSFAWTLPTGWVVLSGAGTSQIQVMCNQTVGQVCVDGFDTAGIFIAQYCYSVAWGGGSGGWDVQLNQVWFCQCGQFTVQPVSNGSGGGCGGCGNGYPSPNIVYAVYDNPWPIGNFMIYANGMDVIGPQSFSVLYYVYCVDITFGINNAILIEGGACPGIVNNTFLMNACIPPILGIVANPDPVCIGDTVTLRYDYLYGPFVSYGWIVFSGNVTFVSAVNGPDSVQMVINAPGSVVIEMSAFDAFGCTYWGSVNVNYQTCNNPPVAAFTAVTNPICPGTCTGFTNLSTNGVSYAWSFTGATPNTSTAANPSNICYNAPGTYDVSLIATNANGSDTLLQSNFITVLPYPPSQSIIQSGDTLFSNTGFTSYQWYYNGTLITGATDYFYVATQNGDYNIISDDANGCEVEAVIFNVVTGIQSSAGSPQSAVVFPNPVTSTFEIRNSIFEIQKISIYNMLGEMVLAADCRLRTVDCGLLSSGMYWLEVTDGEKTFRSKFIKQ